MIICNELFIKELSHIKGRKRLRKSLYNCIKEGVERTPDGCLVLSYMRRINPHIEEYKFEDPIAKECFYNESAIPKSKKNPYKDLEQMMNYVEKTIELLKGVKDRNDVMIYVFKYNYGYKILWNEVREGIQPWLDPKDIEEFTYPIAFFIVK